MANLLGCSLAALLLASGGVGAQAVDTTIQDDAVMLHRSDAEVREAVAQMRDLGTDYVRITASWSALAPAPRAATQPGEPFNPTDSRTYPQAGFAALDRAVRMASARGLKVQLDLAFWAPRWAVHRRGENPERERFGPRPAEYAQFVEAVVRRYDGEWTDPRQGILRPPPRVDLYTTWNEPNKYTFLAPQWIRTGKKAKGRARPYRPLAPHIFRPMHERAYSVIKAVNPQATVLLGGLNGRGNRRGGRRGVPPLTFLRTMACLDKHYQPLGVRECRGFSGPLRADGLSLHPYSMHVPPNTPAKDPDNVFLGDLPRVHAVLDRLVELGRIDGDWPLYITEYGYETSPPDPTAQHSPADQARFMAWATYLAHNDPSVKMFAQFLLRDTPVNAVPRGRDARRNNFQTGLLFANGDPKPGAQAFKLPLFGALDTTAAGDPALVLYGGVRPAVGSAIVRVERLTGPDQWTPVPTLGATCGETGFDFATESNGFFRRLAPWAGPGQYRLVWQNGPVSEVGPAIEVTDEPVLD